MSNFTIESPAQVPWAFHDDGPRRTRGDAPGIDATIVLSNGLAKSYRCAVFSRDAGVSTREVFGLARAVAAVLEMGDTIACELAARRDSETSGPSSTASFSQVRENTPSIGSKNV